MAQQTGFTVMKREKHVIPGMTEQHPLPRADLAVRVT
jgi:hypothetical protein